MSSAAVPPIAEPAGALAEDVPERRLHPARLTLSRLFHHRLFLTGLLLFLVIAALAVLAPWITTADPNRLSMRNKFLPPGGDWVFGTDSLGRSLWSRSVWGAQLSMIIGASVVLINAVFGTLIGALAGYFRALDNALMRVNDALMAFPAILLAIAVTAVLGPSTLNVILALGIVYVPRTARIVRSSVIVLREMEYVQAAVAAGAGHWRILRRHILPNAMAPMIVQLSFLFAYAVLSEATLSFLGVGAVPPTPTWGNIMAEGRDFMRDAPWIIAIPGALLAVTVMGLNLLGDGLRDVLDPRLRIQQ
ncbi:MAG TPA: ABC transporter permease [Acetobacteraceae bacterium]|nr:ABC transporter permease [Acetobacteraceae bacterium]